MWNIKQQSYIILTDYTLQLTFPTTNRVDTNEHQKTDKIANSSIPVIQHASGSTTKDSE